MEAFDEKTAHRCDNCQTEGPTARLDIGKGASAQLCAACWARLMTWRQRQNARQKGPTFVILPWPLAEGGAPTH
jgi:hypothetical protein